MRSSGKVTVTGRRANAIAIVLCVFFVLSGSLWIWKPGVQTDEVLFSGAIWSPQYLAFIRIFKQDYATMVMTYVGALKGQVWRPIFALAGVSAETIRFPALLIGALGVWWFYRLCVRTVGQRAALAGVALLATDSTYLMTVRWDWGPVAFQHLFLIGGLLGLVRFHQSRRLLFLFLAFFAFGLALWDKALFAWSLAALGVAGLAFFWREIWSHFRVATVITATAGLLLGAYPLIRYNVKNDWVTFRSNARPNTESYWTKVRLLRHTLNAEAVGAPIIREWWDGPQRAPESMGERAVVAVSTAFGHPIRNLQELLFVAALLALPLVWRTPARRAVLFSLLWMGLTWIQMAMVEMGGTSTHHTILLWPMPILIIAAGLAWASYRIGHGRTVLAVAVGLACLWNVIVTNTWYSNLVRFGGVPAWTEAFYPLSDALKDEKADHVCLIEWGFQDNLNTFHQGKLPLCITEDPTTDETRKYALAQIANPKIVYVTHAPSHAIEKERTERYLAFAAEHGYRRVKLRHFADSNGRDVVELFRFAKAD